MAFSLEDYDPVRPGMIRSAATVVPEILRLIDPARVVDVGCGQGVWLAEFERHGCKVHGFDGHDGSRLDIAREDYTQVDLDTVTTLDGFHDLAVCLEVAEHLVPGRAGWLVRGLCGLADVVLFSAAIPGQGGHNHVNEQWPDYWAGLFEQAGFTVSGALRRLWWDDVPDAIEPWYAQNMLLCVREEALMQWPTGLLAPLFAVDACDAWPMVHPFYWEHR